jgi:hypothetical protein
MSKRELHGLLEKLESAKTRLEKISRNPSSGPYGPYVREVLDRDLNPAIEKAEYLLSVAE